MLEAEAHEEGAPDLDAAPLALSQPLAMLLTDGRPLLENVAGTETVVVGTLEAVVQAEGAPEVDAAPLETLLRLGEPLDV